MLKGALSGVVCLVLLGTPAAADLDLGMPSGSALDWDADLHQPIPTSVTGRRGILVRRPGDEGTQVQMPPSHPMAVSGINLYNFFRVKTHDIMTHFKVNLPAPRKYKPAPPPIVIPTSEPARRPPDVPEKFESGIHADYVPRLPGELVWIGIATCLRSELHPEVVNLDEALAYLIEIGEPALVAPDSIETALGTRLKGLVSRAPDGYPRFPRLKGPVDQLCARLATIELTAGHPYSMDPRYAKRTLMLGEMAYEGVLACARSNHTFLARNAVAVLANFPSRDRVGADLLDLAQKSSDPVIRVRALAGIARRKDHARLPKLIELVKNERGYIRAMAIHATGRVADPRDVKAARKLVDMTAGASHDLLWTLLSALARIGCRDDAVRKKIHSLWQDLAGRAAGIAPYRPKPVPPGQGNGFVPPNPEPKGYKLRVLADLALLAAAGSGDPAAVTQLHVRASAGVGSFTDPSKILMVEVLPLTGVRGVELAKQIAASQSPSSKDPTRAAGADPNIAVAAIRAIGRAKPPELKYLKGIAAGNGSALTRAAALTALYGISHHDLKEVCHGILEAASVTTSEEAFLAGMAVQMLDQLNDNNGEELLTLARNALAARMVATRDAANEYDITQARIDLRPPLAEIAVLALGKTGYAKAIPDLIEWSKTGPVRGEATLALGGMTGAEVWEALLNAMVDPKDGWVRMCAYLSLRNVTKCDYYADYMFGKPGSIWARRRMYERKIGKGN